MFRKLRLYYWGMQLYDILNLMHGTNTAPDKHRLCFQAQSKIVIKDDLHVACHV